jgi:cytochrome c oxidase subunit IV
MSDQNTIPYESSHTASDQSEVHVHVVSPRVLLSVYAVLVAATIATVAITLVDLGALNIWAALGIAVFKTAFVILFFMHIIYDKPLYGVIVITALMFIMVFIGVTLMDTAEYQMNDQPQGTRQMMSSQDGL